MTSSTLAIIISAILASHLCAFQIHHSTSPPSLLTAQSRGLTPVELKPEPELGSDIQPVETLPNTRVKNLGPQSIKSEDGQVYKFWMKTEANGSLISELRNQVVKDASKRANFPGFRKGQIPPYAQSKMTTFAIQEGIIKSCEATVKAYGLKALSGNDGSVEVHEDMQEVSKIYKLGDNLPFTATFQAVFDPEKQQKVELVDDNN